MPKVAVFDRTFGGASQLRVAVGTTGPKGGDSGHGGRTLLALYDDEDTCDLRVTPGLGGVLLELGGDAELAALVETLTFALAVLRGEGPPAEECLYELEVE